MIDDVGDIADFYAASKEDENVRLERHQLERDLTWRYLDRFLPAAGAILEIGAATGGYTVELARRGYEITAVDMTPAMLEENKKHLAAAGLAGQVRYVQADARDLGPVAGQAFDAVLLMGPLYHLIEEADRRLALTQAYERLKSGGVIFTAFISRLGIMGDVMRDVPGWIEDQVAVRSHLERGKRPDGRPKVGFRGYFVRAAEIAPLHEGIGFETVAVAGVEPAISADDDSYNRLQGKRRQLWLALLDELSSEPSIIDSSRHLLYVGRKR